MKLINNSHLSPKNFPLSSLPEGKQGTLLPCLYHKEGKKGAKCSLQQTHFRVDWKGHHIFEPGPLTVLVSPRGTPRKAAKGTAEPPYNLYLGGIPVLRGTHGPAHANQGKWQNRRCACPCLHDQRGMDQTLAQPAPAPLHAVIQVYTAFRTPMRTRVAFSSGDRATAY